MSIDGNKSMKANIDVGREPYPLEFEVSTIKHLGLQMYSTLPPVIGELIANAWDANATKVEITIPTEQINETTSEIIIKDNGVGMSDEDIRTKYLIVGRDRRENEDSDTTPPPYERKIMGRKGIGKFSAFGIAKEIDIESSKTDSDESSHFRMNYGEMLERASQRRIEFPRLPATGDVSIGTTIRLKQFIKFKNRKISIDTLRKGLARRFAVIGTQGFQIIINGAPLSVEERDLQRLLEKDTDGRPYLWKYENEEIEPGTGWTVSGWIGALNRTTQNLDGIDRGIALMARGKLVQEPFIFDAVVGQQYALSYIVGELHVEFVDEEEDTIGTNRNALVWDTEANSALKDWGQKEINRIARKWAQKRNSDKERQLEKNPSYQEFLTRASETGNNRARSIANKLVRQEIRRNPTDDVDDLTPLIETCITFMEFSAFLDIAEDLTNAGLEDITQILNLFREWEIVEAKEMARISEGRIKTIEKLQQLIEENALEVPTLHNFLKEFPWVIDPRWTLVADEISYTQILRNEFPESNIAERDRRIDFLCVSESTNLVVVEIKRPGVKVSKKDLDQIEDYVSFMRNYTKKLPTSILNMNTLSDTFSAVVWWTITKCEKSVIT